MMKFISFTKRQQASICENVYVKTIVKCIFVKEEMARKSAILLIYLFLRILFIYVSERQRGRWEGEGQAETH